MNNDSNQPQGVQSMGGVGLPPLPPMPETPVAPATPTTPTATLVPGAAEAVVPAPPPSTPAPERVVPAPLPTLPDAPLAETKEVETVPAPTPPASTNEPVVEEKKKKKGSKKGLLAGVAVLLLLAGGGGLGLYLTNRVTNVAEKQDVRSKAFSGYQAGSAALLKYKNAQQDAAAVKEAAAADIDERYYNLAKLSAQTQNPEIIYFSDKATEVNGVAFLTFVPTLGRTFVFTKIEGLPYPEGKYARVWITKDGVEYEDAGIVEFVREKEGVAGYSIVVRDFDLRKYKSLVVSYDSSLIVKAPEEAALTIHF